MTSKRRVVSDDFSLNVLEAFETYLEQLGQHGAAAEIRRNHRDLEIALSIAKARAQHLAEATRAGLRDSALREHMAAIEANWERNPTEMLHNWRSTQRRAAMLQRHPDRRRAYAAVLRATRRGQLTAEETAAKLGSLDLEFLATDEFES